jgi:hypothetical protein
MLSEYIPPKLWMEKEALRMNQNAGRHKVERTCCWRHTGSKLPSRSRSQASGNQLCAMENQIKNTFDKYKRTVVHTVDLEVQKKLLEHLLLDCVHLDNSRKEFLFDV